MEDTRLSYFWGGFFFLHGLPSGPRCPLLVQGHAFQAVSVPDSAEGGQQFGGYAQFQRGDIWSNY